MTDALRKLYDSIWAKYPKECKRIGFNEAMFLGWIESYQNKYDKPSDFVPEIDALINLVEENKNRDGKSFLKIPETIEYTPIGKKRQTYTIIGNNWCIYNLHSKNIKCLIKTNVHSSR